HRASLAGDGADRRQRATAPFMAVGAGGREQGGGGREERQSSRAQRGDENTHRSGRSVPLTWFAVAVQTLERRPTRLYWWKEASLVLAFYLVYSFTRNRFGSHRVEVGEEPLHAFNNALRIIDWEKALHLFHEQQIQSRFLDFTIFLQFWNTFYGTAHFLVTAGAFIWLYRARPAIFPLWRNVLGATTALAILGFSLFPLMPP